MKIFLKDATNVKILKIFWKNCKKNEKLFWKILKDEKMLKKVLKNEKMLKKF